MQKNLLLYTSVHGGVFKMTQDLAEAQPVQIELHRDRSSRIRRQLLKNMYINNGMVC